MGVVKLVVLIVLVIGLMMLWRRFKAWQQTARNKAAAPPRPALMVRCAQCQLHLPQDQAIRSANQWYCCNAHRDAGHHD